MIEVLVNHRYQNRFDGRICRVLSIENFNVEHIDGLTGAINITNRPIFLRNWNLWK